MNVTMTMTMTKNKIQNRSFGLNADLWIHFYWLSRLRQASHRNMIQSSALRQRLCQFKIPSDTPAFSYLLPGQIKRTQKSNHIYISKLSYICNFYINCTYPFIHLRAFTLQISRLCDTIILLTNCNAETVQQKMVTAVANYQVFQSHLFFSVKICASFPNQPWNFCKFVIKKPFHSKCVESLQKYILH